MKGRAGIACFSIISAVARTKTLINILAIGRMSSKAKEGNMELKPCTCGGTDITLRLAVQVKSGKGAYCYQCKKCKKAAYAWAESEEIATELWNDTVNNTQKLRVDK